MTFEEAVKKHRKMWNWIAKETLKRGRKVYKEDYFLERDIPDEKIPLCLCYCCEFVNKKEKYNCKTFCPVIWGYFPEKCGMHMCTHGKSIYKLWLDTTDSKEAAKYALEIANLPERRL